MLYRSSAVSVNGTNVESQVTQAALIKNMATTFVYNEGPVFSLTVVDTLGKRLIIPSDVQYQDINQVAFLLIFMGLQFDSVGFPFQINELIFPL